MIGHLELNNATVTIDAAGCQKNVAEKIIERGGNSLLALKGNQGTLYQSALDWVQEQLENGFVETAVRTFSETVKGHGREDSVEYFHLHVPSSLAGKAEWKEQRTIRVAIRTRVRGENESCDVRFFISSLRLGVRHFAAACRGHWGIENSLHRCLDVPFREDDNRVQDCHAADNLPWLKRLAISLSKQQNDKKSITMRRRMAGWNIDYMMQVLGVKAI